MSETPTSPSPAQVQQQQPSRRKPGRRATRKAEHDARKTDLRDFDDAMPELLPKATRARVYIALGLPVGLVLAGAALGALVRWAVPPSWAVLVTVSAALALMALAVAAENVAYRLGPVPDVDWATAAVYKDRLVQQLPRASRAALADAHLQIRGRWPGTAVYPWRSTVRAEHAEICTIDRGGCYCWPLRLIGAVRPGSRRMVIVAGDLLLDDPAALRYVLAHETRHTARSSLLLNRALAQPLIVGWFVLGLALPWHLLMVAAPALWVITTTLRWVDEIVADVAAARVTRPGDACAFWTRYYALQPRQARWRTITQTMLAPHHPPAMLRAALADRLQSGDRT